MPIYEFYCADCHTVYSFFSRRINTEKRPDCPRCGRPQLERRVSRFAIGRGGASSTEEKEGGEGEDDDFLPPGVDEEKFERAMMELASEAENMDEDDPRQMARLMRKLSQSTGLQFGGAMEEAIRRLEAGEDPESIEEDLGDLLEQEEPIFQQSGRSLKTIVQQFLPPRKEETLYDLDAAPSSEPAAEAKTKVAPLENKGAKKTSRKPAGKKTSGSTSAKRKRNSSRKR